MSNIKELFITYESAYRLRELGFDEPCFAYYDYYNGRGHLCEPKIYTNWFQKLMSKIFKKNTEYFHQFYVDYLTDDCGCSAPTYQQAFNWLREQYGCQYQIHQWLDNKKYIIRQSLLEKDTNETIFNGYIEEFETYEKAEEKCIEYFIDLIDYYYYNIPFNKKQ